MTVDGSAPGRLPADPVELLELATPIATEVAARLLAVVEGAGDEPRVSTKSGVTDLVTDLDRWAEGHITESLLESRPGDGLVGEEGASVTGTSGVDWCVDPIDGTVNFVHGIPGFCVSIAAQVEGRSVAAVVASPMHGDVFTATIGGGAQRNGRDIECSATPGLQRAVIGTGFGYDPARRTRQAAVLQRVIADIADIRRGGAAALDLCSVACGRLDGYWEVGLNPWDHAAGALIAAEAGAVVGDLRGGAPSGDFTLAAPPQLWEPLRDLLTAAAADAV
ncbi:MAG: inositol monophosphatase [Acidimicrobiales bacterium]|nr:inositol monophosphatase [Acidimicrobiales bacterium]